MTLKEFILTVAKSAGFFHLARWMTGEALRILCFHGFAFRDEARFRPKLTIDDGIYTYPPSRRRR